MSRNVAALVYRKRIGSMARKAILAYCAERVNDDGSGMWASKSRIAQEVECSKQTVISVFKEFIEEGLLIEVGRRKRPNGYVFEYDVNIAQILELEDAFDDPFSTEKTTGPNLDTSNELTPKGQTALPQRVKPLDSNRPITVLKPSEDPKPLEGDLFGDQNFEEEKTESDQPDEIDQGFEEFWKNWPSHKRKTGQVKAKALYRKACEGNLASFAGQVTPQVLNKAATAYVRDLKGDLTYLKGVCPWLNEPGFEPYLESDAPEYREEDLTDRQRDMLSQGRVPPSMQDENGDPNEQAKFFLKLYLGDRVEAAE